MYNFNVRSGNRIQHGVNLKLLDELQLRQRYIQLMRDAEKALGRKDAIHLMKEANSILEKLNASQ